jgi:hypothetical protein
VGQGDGSRASFTINGVGAHAVELVVTNRSGRTAGMRTRISTGQGGNERTEVSREELFRGLIQQTADGTFARWFLTNYATCMGSNPLRVGEESLWRPDRSGIARQFTFRRPTSSDLEELREWYDSLETITAANEDGIRLFAENRRQLQMTVDYWAAIRRNEQDDSRLSYRNRQEYLNFAVIMSSNPPRIDLPPGGVP